MTEAISSRWSFYLFDVTLRGAKEEHCVVSSCCGSNGRQLNPWKLLQWNSIKGNGSNQRTILLGFSTIAGVHIHSLKIIIRQTTNRLHTTKIKNIDHIPKLAMSLAEIRFSVLKPKTVAISLATSFRIHLFVIVIMRIT